jgi:hypothetical protein
VKEANYTSQQKSKIEAKSDKTSAKSTTFVLTPFQKINTSEKTQRENKRKQKKKQRENQYGDRATREEGSLLSRRANE